MSNKIFYSIFILLFILMPLSIIKAIFHYLSEKFSFIFKGFSRMETDMYNQSAGNLSV